jgi:tryptophan synthase beta chain
VNFLGLASPFLGKILREKRNLRLVAAEPTACPSLTRGRYAHDFIDSAHIGPVLKMHTLGSNFMPPGFHAGGLRIHGTAPLVSHLKELGLIEAIDEALKCKQEGKARTILFNLSGNGNFDMQAYADYFAGKLEDRDLDQAALDATFRELPRVAAE